MSTILPLPVQSATTDQKISLYQEVCNSYRAVDDYRTKLLGFLPLASRAGIFFLLNNSFTVGGKSTAITSYLLPIGIVGAIITFGLAIYDLRALQLKVSFVKTGKEIEHSLGIIGQFLMRPHTRFGIINDLGGSTFVYTALIAGWLFLALISSSSLVALIVAAVLFSLGFIVLLFSKNIEQILYHDEMQQLKPPGDKSGKATIPIGQKSIPIASNAVQEDSTITVMPIMPNTMFVTNLVPGYSFAVELEQLSHTPVEFSWRINN